MRPGTNKSLKSNIQKRHEVARTIRQMYGGGGGGWHKASVSDCLPLVAPIGFSPLLILTLGGGGLRQGFTRCCHQQHDDARQIAVGCFGVRLVASPSRRHLQRGLKAKGPNET